MFNNPTFLIIDELNLYWHGLLLAAALAAGMTLSWKLKKKQTGEDGKDILITYIITLPLAFFGARAYYCWCKADQFTDFSQYFDFGNGGFGLLGAIAAACIGILISSLVLHLNSGELFDVMAPGIGLAIAIGRWGAIFTNENLGGAVTAEFFQHMPFAVYSESEDIYRKAFFVGGSLLALGLSLAASWLFEQRYIKHNISNQSGDIFMLFISIYFLLQGIFEQYRYDPLYFNLDNVYLRKLQTVSATLALGALLGAVPLACMILRNLFKRGFKLKYLWHIPACALLFFGYFNIVLRVESVNEQYNGAVLIFSAVGLVLIALSLFIGSAKISSRLLPSRRIQQRPSPRQNPPVRQRPNGYRPGVSRNVQHRQRYGGTRY